jgi:hypothetical protein
MSAGKKKSHDARPKPGTGDRRGHSHRTTLAEFGQWGAGNIYSSLDYAPVIFTSAKSGFPSSIDFLKP